MTTQTSTWDMPLRVWKNLKLHNEQQTISTFTALYWILLIFIDIMVLLQFKDMKGDITDLLENVEAFAMYTHGLLKLGIITFYKNKLSRILNNTKRFWKIKECPEELRSNLERLGNFSRLLQMLLVYGCTAIGFAISLISMWTISLIFGYWNINKQYSFMHYLAIVAQVITLPIEALFVSAFDSLFLAFLMEAVMQFRILCYYIRNLKYSSSSKKSQKDCADKLTSCIRHHIFMLSCVESLKEYFSLAILTEYLSKGPLFCAEMYMFFEISTISWLTKHGGVFWGINFQFAFYCIATDFLSSEAAAVTDAIYDSDWYTEYNPTMRSSIRLMIQRSQRGVAFTAAELVVINSRTLAKVLNASWSACNVMRAIRSDP